MSKIELGQHGYTPKFGNDEEYALKALDVNLECAEWFSLELKNDPKVML